MVVEQVPCGPWETGEPWRIEQGASLPPRKRLLAGLKQNGWFSSSAASASSSSLCLWQGSTSAASHVSTELKKREGMATEAANLSGKAQQGGEDGKEWLIINHGEGILDKQRDLDQDQCCAKSFKQNLICGETCDLQQESMVNGSSDDINADSSSSDCGMRSCRLKRKAGSPNNEVEAAKLTAAAAAKVAAEARATAAAKAQAAAKAAAVAKAALDAAAIVACKAESNSRRLPATMASRVMKKKKKKDAKRERTDSGNSQMPAPVNDEELARQLHRAMNSSPRISRGISLQAKGSSAVGAKVASVKWIGDSLPTSVMGRKNQQMQPKDGRKHRGAKKNSRFSEIRVKMESQSTDESSKSTLIDVTAVTSIQSSGLFIGEHKGEATTDHQLVENVDTSANEGLGTFSSREGKFDKDAIINQGCHVGRVTMSESACEALDVSACEHVETPKRVHDVTVPKLGKGQNKIANGEVHTGNDDIDEGFSLKMDQSTTVGTRNVPDRISIEDQKKEADMATNVLRGLTETISTTSGKRAKQHSDKEPCKERGIDELLKNSRTVTDDQKKKSEHLNNSTTGSGVESGDNWHINMELKQHDEIKCTSSVRDNRSLVKQRSFDTRSNALSKGQSCIGSAQVRSQSFPKGTVKKISSGIESFIGERNVAHFGSSSAVPVRAAALRKHAFANGPSTRNV